MDAILKTMINAMNVFGSSFGSCKIGKYTIMVTDDEDGAERLKDTWDKYVEEEKIHDSYGDLLSRLKVEREGQHGKINDK